jgi:ABC-type bacteriocin/lantibiotic exporter with double-glycine peptidase domain
MYNQFQKILKLRKYNKENSFNVLLLLMIISALIDGAGIALIMPYMKIVTNPELIVEITPIYYIFKRLGYESQKQFIIHLGIMLMSFLIGAMVTRAYSLQKQVKYSLICECNIAEVILKNYLNKNYNWFIENNTSQIQKDVLIELGNVINESLMPLLTMMAQIILAATILTILLIHDYKVATIACMILTSTYFLIYTYLKIKLLNIGIVRSEANKKRSMVLSEALKSIKVIKIHRQENIIVKNYKKYALSYANNHSYATTLSSIPRFFIEAIAMSGVVIAIILNFSNNKNIEALIPVFSLYILAGYKLIPSLQSIFYSLSQIRYSKSGLDAISLNLEEVEQQNYTGSNGSFKKIIVDGLIYNANGNKNILNNINLNIENGDKIGIVGKSGAGKTTLMDIIIGLREPTDGKIFIDELCLDSKDKLFEILRVGYVPQEIILYDTTIASNIAVGIEEHDIDWERIFWAAKISGVDRYLEGNTIDSYKNNVGEIGSRLSGGQRQRIALARALYSKPEILFLDEATSALDIEVENEIIHNLNYIDYSITILQISHRISSLRNCNKIYKILNGNLQQIEINMNYSEI